MVLSDAVVTMSLSTEVCDEPFSHEALEPEPAGSRSIIITLSGPAVTKLLPDGSAPMMIPFSGLVFQGMVWLLYS